MHDISSLYGPNVAQSAHENNAPAPVMHEQKGKRTWHSSTYASSGTMAAATGCTLIVNEIMPIMSNGDVERTVCVVSLNLLVK